MRTLTEIKRQIQDKSRRGLDNAIEALTGNDKWVGGDKENCLRYPVYDARLTNEDIRAFYEDFDICDAEVARAARMIRGQEEQLLAAIHGKLPDCLEPRKDWGLKITLYLAGVFTPCMAALKEFHLAENAAAHFVSRMFSHEMRNVVGAGTMGKLPLEYRSKTEDPEVNVLQLRQLLLAPVFMSLAAFYPLTAADDEQ